MVSPPTTALTDHDLSKRLRMAIQYCKDKVGLTDVYHASRVTPENKFAMERCLTEDFLLKRGMNFFGKKDLIFIDMRG